MKDKLDANDLMLLKTFPVFAKLVVEATNLQLGKRAAVRPAIRERRVRVYKKAPGFRPGPRERETLPRV